MFKLCQQFVIKYDNIDKLGFIDMLAQTQLPFCVAFLKATAPRVVALAAKANSPFLFCKAFFFVAIPPKKKALKKS